jgi:hypothetical protein
MAVPCYPRDGLQLERSPGGRLEGTALLRRFVGRDDRRCLFGIATAAEYRNNHRMILISLIGRGRTNKATAVVTSNRGRFRPGQTRRRRPRRIVRLALDRVRRIGQVPTPRAGGGHRATRPAVGLGSRNCRAASVERVNGSLPRRRGGPHGLWNSRKSPGIRPIRTKSGRVAPLDTRRPLGNHRRDPRPGANRVAGRHTRGRCVQRDLPLRSRCQNSSPGPESRRIDCSSDWSRWPLSAWR